MQLLPIRLLQMNAAYTEARRCSPYKWPLKNRYFHSGLTWLMWRHGCTSALPGSITCCNYCPFQLKLQLHRRFVRVMISLFFISFFNCFSAVYKPKKINKNCSTFKQLKLSTARLFVEKTFPTLWLEPNWSLFGAGLIIKGLCLLQKALFAFRVKTFF